MEPQTNDPEPLSQIVDKKDWNYLIALLETPDSSLLPQLLKSFENHFEFHPLQKSDMPLLLKILLKCFPSCFPALLKNKPKFSFLHLDSWKFPQALFSFLKKITQTQPLPEVIEFFDSTNPYPKRFQEFLTEIQTEGHQLVVIQNTTSPHISVVCDSVLPTTANFVYNCRPLSLMCYPVAIKENRHLGPKNFHAVGWCTIKFEVPIGSLPLLKPRNSANFHLSFALLGWHAK